MIVERFTAIAIMHLRGRRSCADGLNGGFVICHLHKKMQTIQSRAIILNTALRRLTFKMKLRPATRIPP